MRFLILALFLVFNLEARSLFSNDNQADSSIYIGSLKDLMIATQKTRGLTSSYMNGNSGALLLIYNARNDMKKAIGIMESTDLATDPVVSTRATNISNALVKINSKAFKMKPAEAFEKYTQQIQEILMLAQTVSTRASKDLNPFGKQASSIMMDSMLSLTEYVGQLRGFGSGLAAKGKISTADSEKIYLLISQVKNLDSQLQSQMKDLITKYSDKFPKGIASEVSAINDDIQAYISYTHQFFTQKNITKVGADSYFITGTRIISQIIKVYDMTNKVVLEDSKGWF